LKLAPILPIAHIEMRQRAGDDARQEDARGGGSSIPAPRELEPRDAMEKLDVEAARAEID
jgi:hypothetical protein